VWAFFLCAIAVAVVFVRWRRSRLPLRTYLSQRTFVVYARLWHGCVVRRGAPLPKKGPAIVVSNHTCSADAALVSAGCRRLLSFIVAKEYYDIPGVGGILTHTECVPARRDGRDAVCLRQGLRRLSEGKVLCIFPEGGLSNAGRGRPRPGKAGVAYLALRSRAPVYPACIVNGPQTYQVLPAWLKPSRARVNFGPAVDLSPYYDRPLTRKLLEEVTALLMNHVAELHPAAKTWEKGERHEHCNRDRPDPQTLSTV
jgi:1-acyl-sn-glycerol-3-phosphate acyltransferase